MNIKLEFDQYDFNHVMMRFKYYEMDIDKKQDARLVIDLSLMFFNFRK